MSEGREELAGGVHSYETLARTAAAELEISRSRFLAELVRVENEDAAREVIARVRAEHPRARHHCSAFVLGPDARIQRSNDDGEPSGTAGLPMLEALTAAGLSDVVAVVTRYFGGVLLGAAGLTRAYRGAVAAAVADCVRVRRELRRTVAVRGGYDIMPILEDGARRRGFAVLTAEYGADVVQRFGVPVERVDELLALAAEVSAGAAVCEPGELGFVDV